MKFPHFQHPKPLPKQIFAAHAKVNIDLHYVLTIYEVCKPIENKVHRHQMYDECGLDGNAVETYLDKVLSLNYLLKHK